MASPVYLSGAKEGKILVEKLVKNQVIWVSKLEEIPENAQVIHVEIIATRMDCDRKQLFEQLRKITSRYVIFILQDYCLPFTATTYGFKTEEAIIEKFKVNFCVQGATFYDFLVDKKSAGAKLEKFLVL